MVGVSKAFSLCAKHEAEVSHITSAKAFALSGRGGIDQYHKAEGLMQNANSKVQSAGFACKESHVTVFTALPSIAQLVEWRTVAIK